MRYFNIFTDLSKSSTNASSTLQTLSIPL